MVWYIRSDYVHLNLRSFKMKFSLLIFVSMSKKTKNKPSIQPSKTKIKKVRSRLKTELETKKQQPTKSSKEPTSDVKPLGPIKDQAYRKYFWGTAFLFLLGLAVMSLFSGINGDDEYQVDYSNKLVDYYLSFGADDAATYIEKGNMHLYGGFFDLLTGLTNYALGFDEFDQAFHHVRHLYNALFGWLAMIFTSLIVVRLAGWRLGILALVFMFLSPRFLGHSLMNPKDIPFAAGFAISIYYMIRLLDFLPKLDWKTLVGLALGLALAIAMRAGGLLLFAYLALFLGTHFLSTYGISGITKQVKIFGNYVMAGLLPSVLGYFLAVLTWPAALANPLGHPIDALSKFSELGIKIRLLFGAENIMSDQTAWNYPIVWIAYTIPLFAMVGFLGALFLLPRLMKKYPISVLVILVFATLFPVVYVIYKDSILHDGWRHLMFIYPSMIVLAVLFWEYVEQAIKNQKTYYYALVAILGLLLLEPAVFIARNTAYPYVYFNPISGGINNAFGNYETDYWGLSVKQALDWMEDEGILSQDMQDTLTIGTSFYFNVSRLTRDRFNGKVKTKYVRFNQRYNEDWQYGIFPSRFIRSGHLKSGNWPNNKTIHVIKANGIPLTAVEKNDSRNAYLGIQAMKQKKWPEAIQYFKEEIGPNPDNEIALGNLANAYLNIGDNLNAIDAAQKTLLAAPKNENGLYYLALAQMRAGKLNEAVKSFQDLLAVNDDYYIASYYLAYIHQQNNQLNLALMYAKQAVESNAKFKQGYELLANIYNKLGDLESAKLNLDRANNL